MTLRSRCIFALLCLGIAAHLCVAQAKKAVRIPISATSWKLLSVKVVGAERYAQDEVLTASGLQLGQIVSEEDFKKASQHLGETGVFDDVRYSYSYTSEGCKLELQVSEGGDFVPARFDNLVWFSDQELQDKLHERVPFFKKGLVPVGGDLADQLSDALQALLIERKIQGKADYLRDAPLNAQIEAIVYTVTAHNISIHNVDFSGAGATELALLRNAAKPLQGHEYTRSSIGLQEKFEFLPIYLQRGYLKAGFGEASTKIAQDGEQATQVDITIPVNPGLQYKLTEIQWSGNKAFPAEQLTPLVHLKIGEPANSVQLAEELRTVNQLYGTLGYMTPIIQPVPEMEDASSTVRYSIQIKEGDVYKMGELEIKGLDEKGRNRLTFFWKLKEGETYDSSYPERFFKETSKELPQGTKWNVTLHEALTEDKTVDISLQYTPGAQ